MHHAIDSTVETSIYSTIEDVIPGGIVGGSIDNLLLETGDNLLQEDGSLILLE